MVLMISAVWKVYVALGEEYANDNLGVGDPPQYFIMFEFTGACFQINRSCQRHDRLSTAWVQFMQLFWQTLLMWYTGLPVWHGPKLCDLKAQVTCSSSRTEVVWVVPNFNKTRWKWSCLWILGHWKGLAFKMGEASRMVMVLLMVAGSYSAEEQCDPSNGGSCLGGMRVNWLVANPPTHASWQSL